MQIEEGKYYKTRSGEVVGPVERDDWGDGYPWVYGDNGSLHWVGDNGIWLSEHEDPRDLIEEWTE